MVGTKRERGVLLMTLEEFADKYKRRRAEWLAAKRPERTVQQFRDGRDVHFSDRYLDATIKEWKK